MFRNSIVNFFKKRNLLKQTSNFTEYVDLSTNLNREIYLNSITPQTAETIDKTIRMWNYLDDADMVEFGKREPIKIYINSLGGDFTAMFIIMDAIKLSRTPVYTINIGAVHKEAFFIYLSGTQKYCYPRATFVYEKDLKHLEELDEQQVDKYYTFYQKQINELKVLMFEKTKITEIEYNKHLKGVWWINADDAYRLKICNEIIYTTIQ